MCYTHRLERVQQHSSKCRAHAWTLWHACRAVNSLLQPGVCCCNLRAYKGHFATCYGVSTSTSPRTMHYSSIRVRVNACHTHVPVPTNLCNHHMRFTFAFVLAAQECPSNEHTNVTHEMNRIPTRSSLPSRRCLHLFSRGLQCDAISTPPSRERREAAARVDARERAERCVVGSTRRGQKKAGLACGHACCGKSPDPRGGLCCYAAPCQGHEKGICIAFAHHRPTTTVTVLRSRRPFHPYKRRQGAHSPPPSFRRASHAQKEAHPLCFLFFSHLGHLGGRSRPGF